MISDYEPITSRIGFIEAQYSDVTDAFHLWIKNLLEKDGGSIELIKISGSLRERILGLSPLVSKTITKFLFMKTQSDWTAYFDNGWRGPDASSKTQVLCRKLKCRGIAVTYVKNTMPSVVGPGTKGRYGATIFELYDGLTEQMTRTIYSSNDGGKWVFGQSGNPLGFEDLSSYQKRSKQDRFNYDLLNAYLGEFGIDCFNENFYDLIGPSVLFKRAIRHGEEIGEYPLAEVQENFAKA